MLPIRIVCSGRRGSCRLLLLLRRVLVGARVRRDVERTQLRDRAVKQAKETVRRKRESAYVHLSETMIHVIGSVCASNKVKLQHI